MKERNNGNGWWRATIGVVLVGVTLSMVACAPAMRLAPPLQRPDEAITFDVGYSKAFDLIVRTLRDEGYEVAVADHRAGVIKTRPRAVSSADHPSGPFDYQTLLSIFVRGGWRSSWAVVNVVVLPDYPKERDRVIEQLKNRLR